MLAALALPACSGGENPTRTVLTDFTHDQFNTSMFGFFPRKTAVHPGDTIQFKQAWTGDAHTVTFGTLLKSIGDIVKPYYDGVKDPPQGEESPPGLDEASAKIPFPFDGEDINQTAGQPCYLKDGPLRDDRKACPRVTQPLFTGREAFYNSGFIPYNGNDGNKFTMKLSPTIAPGEYFYYCLMHGAGMGGFIEVKPKSQSIPSQGAVNKAAQKEIDETLKDMEQSDKDARAGKWDVPPGEPKVDVLAGAFTTHSFVTGLVDEFYPQKFTAKVGQKVTWMLFGHTVSFKVPKYGPQLSFDPKTHVVSQNPKAYLPVGVEIPETDPEDQVEPAPVDAGTYDGSKFLSSGVQFGLKFSVTFTKPGTYQYACLVHPRQVGTLVVKG
jgi:plastocyanin